MSWTCTGIRIGRGLSCATSRRCFQNCSLWQRPVATTHSPFIVQSLDGQGLVNLSGGNLLEERREHYSIEDVAEETMGVDSPQRSKRFLDMEAAAQRYYSLLERLADDDPEVIEAKAELDWIEARFSDNAAYAALLKLHGTAAE